MMSLCGYERRKDPEKVRAALIDAAAGLIAEDGLAKLTVDAVARSAGVTKGGLFHHFPSKQDLIHGVLDIMIGFAKETTAIRMAADPEPHGSFTRAYLENVFVEHRLSGQVSARALCRAMLADPSLQEIWVDWVERCVADHAVTDDNPACALVRLAADGILLNSLRRSTPPPPLPDDLHALLMALTRPSP